MKKIGITIIVILLIVALAGCQAQDKEASAVVNIYTDRHYDTDQALYDQFTEETGIQVNVVKAGSDELIERLASEGEATEVDLMITSDAGRLVRAQNKNLLQPITSNKVKENVPEQLREKDSNWTALTMRARVIVYARDRISPDDLSTYEALTEPKWKGKLLVRSASNIYNQSLLASLIALNGERQAQEWAEGLVENMARTPEGNDRDQMKALVAGEGDLAIVNTYYVGKMLNSSDPYEVEVAEQIGIFFPNQKTTGTHINISGAGVTRFAKHADAANQLLEFLTGEGAQADYANANYEYPVNPKVAASDLLDSWGEFSRQELSLSVLGENNSTAVKIFNTANWQ
ncbi:Fe(3+) ABC transporter substrate-binding protein [Gottschalkiaceae bacterium SANA]|nr:Fe(3+) ABC transporter substrate-binding protein [Gottschalkiaceae bacterium SANA]